MKYCINCGHELPDHAMFCSNCGAKQPGENVKEEPVAEVQASNETAAKKEKPKTDLSAFMKVRVFAMWGIAPLLFLIMNIIFASIGKPQIITVLFQMLFSALGIVMNTINFVKRINRKAFNYEFGIALSLAAIDSIVIICAFILVSSI